MQTGETWTGKIVGVSHVVEGTEISTRLQIKRPTDFALG
jgi:hypothetical protein